MKKNIYLILLVIFLNACSDEIITPQDEIRNYIEAGKLAAENRSYNDLADLISEQYKDQRGYNKKRIKDLARALFLMQRNIYLLIKINSIEFQSDNSAFVVFHVAMAGTAIGDSSMLSQLRAKIYKFEIQLNKDEQWLLTQAKWKPARINAMF